MHDTCRCVKCGVRLAAATDRYAHACVSVVSLWLFAGAGEQAAAKGALREQVPGSAWQCRVWLRCPRATVADASESTETPPFLRLDRCRRHTGQARLRREQQACRIRGSCAERTVAAGLAAGGLAGPPAHTRAGSTHAQPPCATSLMSRGVPVGGVVHMEYGFEPARLPCILLLSESSMGFVYCAARARASSLRRSTGLSHWSSRNPSGHSSVGQRPPQPSTIAKGAPRTCASSQCKDVLPHNRANGATTTPRNSRDRGPHRISPRPRP